MTVTIDEQNGSGLLVRVAEELGRDQFAPSDGWGASAAQRLLDARHHRCVR